MIEVLLRDYLKTNMDGIPVYMEMPQTIPDKFVVMYKIDSGRINMIDAATFRFEIRAHSNYDAAVLCEQVKDILFDAISMPEISSATLGGEQQTTDIANHLYLYNLTFNFYYYI